MITMISERKTIKKYHPGEYVRDALEALDMTAKEFSMRTGISERMLSGIISGNCSITFDIAFKLSEYFDNSINFWTNLQNQYDSYQREMETKQSIEEDWKLIKDIKKYLLQFHIINADDDNDTVVYKARRIAGVNRLSLINNKNLLVCFKEQHTRKPSNYFYQNFWIALALNEARRSSFLAFNKEKLLSSLGKIRSMTTMEPETFYPELEQLFSDCGVSFVLLPYLPKSNIYGVTKWLNKDNVMLSVSNRGERADLFWFTICHEVAHVLMEHKREALISMDGADDKEADKMAEDILIPREEWDDFIFNTRFFSATNVKAFAKKIGVHPSIVLGRLHNEKLVPYGKLDKTFELSYQVVAN